MLRSPFTPAAAAANADPSEDTSPENATFLRRYLAAFVFLSAVLFIFNSLDSLRFLTFSSSPPSTSSSSPSSAIAFFYSPGYRRSFSSSSSSSPPFTYLFPARNNIPYQDADIMWFRDPFAHFSPDADFQIACDYFSGSALDMNNRPNGGFNYVRSNNRSIEFYKFWYSSQREYPGYHGQDVLNYIKNSPYITKLGLKMRFLDTAYFGGFCQPSKDFNKVCTMHANCCYGLDSKLYDLRIMLDDWRFFLSIPPSLRNPQGYTWRVPRNCSVSPYQPPTKKYRGKGSRSLRS